MVFLIQSTQNRDVLATHIKLDELLRAVSEARTGLMNLEDRSDEELQKVKLELAEISNGSDASTIALGQPGPPSQPVSQVANTPTADFPS
jgi:low affinity Fe/Cu permease